MLFSDAMRNGNRIFTYQFRIQGKFGVMMMYNLPTIIFT